MRDLLPGDLYEGWAEERRRELRGTYLALLLACDGVTRTAGIHTLSRRAAVAFGEKVPVSRLVVNTSTTHGTLGLSTALSPSWALVYVSRGNKVSSGNVSQLHMMDVKRIASETRPIEGVTPAPIDTAWEPKTAA